MEKYFLLMVKPGSVIHRANGVRQTLTEVPKNALELWENGSTTLSLRKEGVELISEFSKERLEAILKLRIKNKYKTEIKVLEDLLKPLPKTRKTTIDKTEK